MKRFEYLATLGVIFLGTLTLYTVLLPLTLPLAAIGWVAEKLGLDP